MSILDRATPAYARGYRDCRDNHPKQFENNGTFYGYDYDEGWWACWNEHYWSAVRENERRAVLKAVCESLVGQLRRQASEPRAAEAAR